ncbi:UNKNOWN [Stylonychia lemnae]|uniref:Uncharacterized protein n=1 Tax=Stylonychia lemnae TaxID=5949 RepID=A0A078AUZ5_STYLE|nr:UNKNOWN [Stylonychia lemnae]|eukprot:CDW86215.1 UNKNOWN [Stylonychia lemnae]
MNEQPFFIGMDDLDFLKNDDNKKFNWVDFSNRVIPFMTDLEAKKLVRQNLKSFEKSKILNSIRVDSSQLLKSEKMEQDENNDSSRRTNERRGLLASHLSSKNGGDSKFHIKVQKQQKMKERFNMMHPPLQKKDIEKINRAQRKYSLSSEKLSGVLLNMRILKVQRGLDQRRYTKAASRLKDEVNLIRNVNAISLLHKKSTARLNVETKNQQNPQKRGSLMFGNGTELKSPNMASRFNQKKNQNNVRSPSTSSVSEKSVSDSDQQAKNLKVDPQKKKPISSLRKSIRQKSNSQYSVIKAPPSRSYSCISSNSKASPASKNQSPTKQQFDDHQDNNSRRIRFDENFNHVVSINELYDGSKLGVISNLKKKLQRTYTDQRKAVQQQQSWENIDVVIQNTLIPPKMQEITMHTYKSQIIHEQKKIAQKMKLYESSKKDNQRPELKIKLQDQQKNMEQTSKQKKTTEKNMKILKSVENRFEIIKSLQKTIKMSKTPCIQSMAQSAVDIYTKQDSKTQLEQHQMIQRKNSKDISVIPCHSRHLTQNFTGIKTYKDQIQLYNQSVKQSSQGQRHQYYDSSKQFASNIHSPLARLGSGADSNTKFELNLRIQTALDMRIQTALDNLGSRKKSKKRRVISEILSSEKIKQIKT